MQARPVIAGDTQHSEAIGRPDAAGGMVVTDDELPGGRMSSGGPILHPAAVRMIDHQRPQAPLPADLATRSLPPAESPEHLDPPRRRLLSTSRPPLLVGHHTATGARCPG
jgi:hypothetical protein